MNQILSNTLAATRNRAQYDECAKSLLAQKSILAHILVNTVKDFEDMNPQDVIPYIEGEPCIGTVSIDPGLTNHKEVFTVDVSTCPKIQGLNTEQTEINEGTIRYDIIFYVRLPDGLSQIIVNIEIQKDEPTNYKLLNRGIYYTCRMVSSQKERDFCGMNFDDMKKVTSIWICMNSKSNSISYYHLTKDELLEPCEWPGNIDLINIMLIGLKEQIPEPKKKSYGLHRLLGVLFSQELNGKEKLDILKQEYDIPTTEKIREDVNHMCNLSEAIEEKAYHNGYDNGYGSGYGSGYDNCLQDTILEMHKEGYSYDQIAKIAKKDVMEISTILESIVCV